MELLNGKKHYVCYLDTCIISEMLKNEDFFKQVQFIKEKVIFVISCYNIIELKKTKLLYEEFFEKFQYMILFLVKNSEHLLEEEVIKYSNSEIMYINIPLTNPIDINYFKGIKNIFFDGKTFEEFIAKYYNTQEEMLSSVKELIPNFILDKRKGLKENAEEFVIYSVVEKLTRKYPQFMINNMPKELRSDIKKEDLPNFLGFKSRCMMLYILFYKFYWTPQKFKLSDTGDLIMSSVYPYVDIIITQRNQAEKLKIIREKHDIIKDKEIYIIKNKKLTII